MNPFQKISATVITVLFLAACSKAPENSGNSDFSVQQAIAASAAYGTRKAELEMEAKKKVDEEVARLAKAKELEERDKVNNEVMFKDIRSGDILAALIKTAGSDVSRGTITLKGVASNLAYNFLGYYDVRGYDTRSAASAFWLWAIENPAQLKVLMDKMKVPMRLNSEFMTRLRVTEAYLKRPFSARDAEDIVAFCKPEGYDWSEALDSKACAGLGKKGVYVTQDVVNVAEFLLRRHSAGGQKLAEQFRLYGLDLLNPR
jgi:hypothetical protein